MQKRRPGAQGVVPMEKDVVGRPGQSCVDLPPQGRVVAPNPINIDPRKRGGVRPSPAGRDIAPRIGRTVGGQKEKPRRTVAGFPESRRAGHGG